MNAQSHNRGFTKIDLAIVLVVLALFFAVSIPAIQRAREQVRRNECLNRLKQIGLAFQNMDSAKHRFPPSCGVEKDAKGKILSMDGWSWCVFILPLMEQAPLYEMLDVREGRPLDGRPSSAGALSTPVREYQCPSFKGDPYVNSETKAAAIANYKASGATHLESLNVASPNPTIPRYGGGSFVLEHPDGGCYPGSIHGTDGFARDGTAHSIIVVETVEPNVARWTVGNEACLVGLPPVVTCEEADHILPYCRPTGFTSGNFWARSTIPDEINKTYLKWDYEKYPYSDGGVSTPSTAAGGPIKFGPSSHHPGATNHLFADGSVVSFSNDVDASAYMFALTRDGGDPNPPGG